jgi:hypothetical protein
MLDKGGAFCLEWGHFI